MRERTVVTMTPIVLSISGISLVAFRTHKFLAQRCLENVRVPEYFFLGMG
jgi:hypothetical protein